jgi:nicotinamide riboside kinase
VSLIVSLVGGESTGKTTLANALVGHLLQNTRLRAALVPEHLRHWCEAHARAPQAHEQAALAQQQAALIAEAAGMPVDVVVSDTSALMVAAYSEQYFADTSLLPAALAQQKGYGLTLLMGLDVPWMADGLFRDSPQARETTDALLRRALQTAAIPFQTLYGTPVQRLEQALALVGARLGQSLTATRPELSEGRVPWQCDACSDPDCEHRLFTALLKNGAAPRSR